jgi:hypothetical protein
MYGGCGLIAAIRLEQRHGANLERIDTRDRSGSAVDLGLVTSSRFIMSQNPRASSRALAHNLPDGCEMQAKKTPRSFGRNTAPSDKPQESLDCGLRVDWRDVRGKVLGVCVVAWGY